MTEEKIPVYKKNVLRRAIHFIELDSKINQPYVLSARDRDPGIDEARDYQDDIESYDEPEDCLPDLSDVTPIFYLPEAGKPRFRLDEFTRYGTTRICLSCREFRRYGAIRSISRLTRQSFHLPRAYMPRFVYIIWNKQEINSPPNGLSRDTLSVSQPR